MLLCIPFYTNKLRIFPHFLFRARKAHENPLIRLFLCAPKALRRLSARSQVFPALLAEIASHPSPIYQEAGSNTTPRVLHNPEYSYYCSQSLPISLFARKLAESIYPQKLAMPMSPRKFAKFSHTHTFTNHPPSTPQPLPDLHTQPPPAPIVNG